MSDQATTQERETAVCPTCQRPLPPETSTARPSRLVGCSYCLNIALVEYGEIGRCATALDGVPPLGQLAPVGSVMEAVLKHLNAALAELPVLPEVPMRVLQMMHDPLTSMTDLAEVIDEDAAISLKVLRISNSALYAGTHQIKDLHVACARLGMRTVANVVHTISQHNVYRTDKPAFRSAMKLLWQHAIASAHSAEAIGAKVAPGKFPAAFIAGLVHDIGKVVLLDILSRRYKGRLGQLTESKELLAKVLHHFHSYAGTHVVQYWKLPPEFTFTTFYADRPENLQEHPYYELSQIVSLASALADSLDYGFSPRVADVYEHPSLGVLGIDASTLGELKERLAEELETTMEIYGAM